jgi:hypothetical protein
MKRRRGGMIVMLLAGLILVFTSLEAEAAVSQPVKQGAISQSEWVWQIEDVLYQSLRHNPNAPVLRGEALRTIQDIGYYLERAGKAARISDHEMMEINAREAVSLLQRGMHKGYFQASDINWILEEISRYLPTARP